MRIIKPSFEIIEQGPGVNGILKQIELAGRTCYKSEDKITPISAMEFVNRMVKSGHGAMLEHGTVYLAMPMETILPIEANGWGRYYRNHYSRSGIVCQVNGEKRVAVTTNYRVLVENGWMKDLEYLCEPTEYHKKRVTVKFMCDRVTGESFLRHRSVDEDHPSVEGTITRDMEKDIDSFARESTRYCNYSRGKFGSALSVIQPPEITDDLLEKHAYKWGTEDLESFRTMCSSIANEKEHLFDVIDIWLFHILASQWSYMMLIDAGWQAQQARRVLPMDIASPLVMTAYVEDWQHFFDLRCDLSAHPQARELAIPLREEFINRGLIEV